MKKKRSNLYRFGLHVLSVFRNSYLEEYPDGKTKRRERRKKR
jgi:hypothetical protein